MSLAALQVMSGRAGFVPDLAMGRLNAPPSYDPVAPFSGTTSTVYPGAIATGAADPAAEERLNNWMDGFLSLSQSRQLGELGKLDAKEKSGTLSADEKRQITFARNILGVTKVAEVDPALLARKDVQQVEELNVVGVRKSPWPMFFAFAAVAGVAVIATGKKGR